MKLSQAWLWVVLEGAAWASLKHLAFVIIKWYMQILKQLSTAKIDIQACQLNINVHLCGSHINEVHLTFSLNAFAHAMLLYVINFTY